jgi:hypothetical protein
VAGFGAIRIHLFEIALFLSLFLTAVVQHRAEGACSGVANCDNRTLTINSSTGGAGRTSNHVNFNIPLLACGSSTVGTPGSGGTGGCNTPASPFNDTSFTGTSNGVCLNPGNLNDPQCLQIPPGADTQFGNGVPAGSSNSFLFQSTNGTFSETDIDAITTQRMDLNNGLSMTITSVPDPDPNNKNGRIHTIHQSIDFSLSQDQQVSTAGPYQQQFKADYNISAVTDSSGNLIGSKSTDSRCAGQPNAACGTFTFHINDPIVNCNNVSSSGFFAVSNGGLVTGSSTATITAPTGNFNVACTSDAGPDGCVGPILNPTIYTPGGQFTNPPGCP